MKLIFMIKKILKNVFQIILYNIIFFSVIYVIINFNVIYGDLLYKLYYNNKKNNELIINNDNLNNVKQWKFILFKKELNNNTNYSSFPWKKEMEKLIDILKILTFNNNKNIDNIINANFNVKEEKNVVTKKHNKDDLMSLTSDLSEEEWNKYWNNSYIYIPELKIEAPIIFPSIEEYNLEEVILKMLEKWVVHRPETQMPDQKWNFFLIWHSSNYPWIKSKYNNIFAKIPKLKNWDKAYVYYKWRKFTYEMYDSIIVPATAIEVYWFLPWYNLSLMTCYPIWTDKKRMVVRFRLLKWKEI